MLFSSFSFIVTAALFACDTDDTILLGGEAKEPGVDSGDTGGGESEVVEEAEVDPIAGCVERVLTESPGYVWISATRNTYDAQARMVLQEMGSGEAQGEIHYPSFTGWVYDAQGRLDGVTYGSRYQGEEYLYEIDYITEYDAQGRVIREAWDDMADGTVEQETVWEWAADGLSRTGTMIWSSQGYASETGVEERYDAEGRLIYQRYDQAYGVQVTTWAYVDGRLSRYEAAVTSDMGDGTTYTYAMITDYTYDAAGNLIEEVTTDDAGSYSYGNAYTYDAAGNPIRVDSIYDYGDAYPEDYYYATWIEQGFDEEGRMLLQSYFYDTTDDHTWAETPYQTATHLWNCPE